jgi:hypothetical protein
MFWRRRKRNDEGSETSTDMVSLSDFKAMAQVLEYLIKRLGYEELEVYNAAVAYGLKYANAKGVMVSQIDVLNRMEDILWRTS